MNTVSPGPVATGLWLGDHGVAETVARAIGGYAAAVARRQASEAATGRFTEPQEVAGLVVLLAGNRAGNVAGANFLIDVGLRRRGERPSRLSYSSNACTSVMRLMRPFSSSSHAMPSTSLPSG